MTAILDGKPAEQEEYLAECVHEVKYKGVRIGAVRHAGGSREGGVSAFGRVIDDRTLPEVHTRGTVWEAITKTPDVDFEARTWKAGVDIPVPTPRLQRWTPGVADKSGSWVQRRKKETITLDGSETITARRCQ